MSSVYLIGLNLVLFTACEKNSTGSENTKSPIKTDVGASSGTKTDTTLSLNNANLAIKDADANQKNILRGQLQASWNSKSFIYKDFKLNFNTATLGDRPADGRSLYISMHGGGGAPAETNDKQYANQNILMGVTEQGKYDTYGIKEGVIIVPRAPTNTWNMWFQDHIDYLFEDIIHAAVLFADVNPNKVYIMGYSAGGDGTFRLASRMADHWAGASMSAGHPGETNPVNFRNLYFALNMGGMDDSFNRNGLAKIWKTKLDSLQTIDAQGYKHEVNIFADKPHWMDLLDKVAIKNMSASIRKPLSNKIVWAQNSFNTRKYFYWLGISDADKNNRTNADNPAKVIKVSYSGNVVRIDENYADELYIYLNDLMVDLSNEITVMYKNKVIFKGKVPRTKTVINETATTRMDSDYIFSAKLIVNKNESAVVVK